VFQLSKISKDLKSDVIKFYGWQIRTNFNQSEQPLRWFTPANHFAHSEQQSLSQMLKAW